MTRVDLSSFNANEGLDRDRSKLIEICWYLFKIVFFLSTFPWPNVLKKIILSAFGAKIGIGVIIKPRVNIHFPWKLIVGNYTWIGEEAFLLNFELISIGDNVCVSQRAFLCGGNHDYKDPTFKYKNGPITIKDGAWIGAQAFIAPNVIIEKGAVITAGSVVYKTQPSYMICTGNPCRPIKDRY